MYQQNLYRVLDNHIKPKVLNRTNRYAKWEYGYNKEHDIVVISKTGKIGDIYEIQGFKIALPKPPKNVFKHKKNKWVKAEYPKELSGIKNIFDWRNYPDEQKEQWFDYIDGEFKRRDEGFWFMSKVNQPI